MCLILINQLLYLFPDFTIGFNQDMFAVENQVAEICAVVKSPAVQCPATFSFDLLLTTSNSNEESASIYSLLNARK